MINEIHAVVGHYCRPRDHAVGAERANFLSRVQNPREFDDSFLEAVRLYQFCELKNTTHAEEETSRD